MTQKYLGHEIPPKIVSFKVNFTIKGHTGGKKAPYLTLDCYKKSLLLCSKNMNNQNLLEKLNEIPHCKKELKVLFSQLFVPINFLRGQTIIGPNLINTSLYFVDIGILRRYPLKLGIPGTSQLFIKGDFISQNGIYLKKASPDFIECLTAVELLSTNNKQLERFFRQQPEAVKLLLCILETQKLKEIQNAEMMRIDPALERYKFASAILGKSIHDLPRRILSSYLRIGEKQLGRILIQFARSK